MKVTVSKYARHIAVSSNCRFSELALERFVSDRLVHEHWRRVNGRAVLQSKDIFYMKCRKTYYMLPAAYEELKDFAGSYADHLGGRVELITKEVVETPRESPKCQHTNHILNLVEEHPDWTFQNKVVDEVCDPESVHKILEVQMGKGKTKMALKCLVRLEAIGLLVVKKAYADKWLGDVKVNLRPKTGELILLSTLPRVYDMIEIMKDPKRKLTGRAPKMYIITTHILDSFLRAEVEGKGRVPDICKDLGVGMVIYDEVHMLFKMNYLSFMFMSAPRVLDLSATLEPDDSFTTARYHERLPGHNRIRLPIDKYIDVIGLGYHIDDPKLKNKMNRMYSYSHTEFEKSILWKKKQLTEYFKMVDKVADKLYTPRSKNGEKLLVFFATKKMCSLYAQHAAKHWPDKTVARNIQGDDYDKFVSADIGVSTPLKSGTAVDIPGLLLAINTVSSKASQQNLQILGRPRKNAAFSTMYVYLFAPKITKHLSYHNHRLTLFSKWVKSHKTMSIGVTI